MADAPSTPPAAVVTPSAAKPVVVRKVDPHKETLFWEHGTKQMSYDAWVAAGVKPEDLLERDYWAHVSGKLADGTKIHAMAEDRSWYVELLVWQKYSNGALVSFIYPPVFIDKGGITREESDFEVFDGGLVQKWCVRRIKDGKVFISQKDSRQEADAELRNWLKAHATRRAA